MRTRSPSCGSDDMLRSVDKLYSQLRRRVQQVEDMKQQLSAKLARVRKREAAVADKEEELEMRSRQLRKRLAKAEDRESSSSPQRAQRPKKNSQTRDARSLSTDSHITPPRVGVKRPPSSPRGAETRRQRGGSPFRSSAKRFQKIAPKRNRSSSASECESRKHRRRAPSSNSRSAVPAEDDGLTGRWGSRALAIGSEVQKYRAPSASPGTRSWSRSQSRGTSACASDRSRQGQTHTHTHTERLRVGLANVAVDGRVSEASMLNLVRAVFVKHSAEDVKRHARANAGMVNDCAEFFAPTFERMSSAGRTAAEQAVHAWLLQRFEKAAGLRVNVDPLPDTLCSSTRAKLDMLASEMPI
eukprot:TRINITY_DN7073_c0_g1_i8.p1 TRINITY_DN7073_c0_g1~~TRINITY_DN7073_c0_g1_i8.p1  ORF type:complete len:386 (+),score=40.46 TRINITY_DN7073_c0_g1_i8:91-1158(+)